MQNHEFVNPVSGRLPLNGFRATIGRFLQNAKGVVAIEVALLAVPFCLIFFAIFECGISFTSQQVLADATDEVAHQIRTGQEKRSDINKASLRAMVCKRIEIMVEQGCPGLEVDLRTYASFADAAAVKVVLKDGDIDMTGFDAAPGPSTSINMLRVFYRWPVMVDLLSTSMANLKGGKTLHFASATWKNEPFDD